MSWPLNVLSIDITIGAWDETANKQKNAETPGKQLIRVGAPSVLADYL